MQYKTVTAAKTKSIALVGHDNRKDELIGWCRKHRQKLAAHKLFATGTSGHLIAKQTSLAVEKLISGPLGGDQQIGALISEQKIDMLIFFWDPLAAQPHDPDVKALLRLAAVWNIPVACNQSSADFIVNSPLFENEYDKSVPDYRHYIHTRITGQ
ncbi:methylglyoxal synthase [Thalassomonas viridans]|uniref:Methylglyoxal synthase n=1 Tax=Thalassomonas viridans TaxID=137584 RepID=A0AAE9YXF3_9GAMM|nr:methylglyoxal synthase [Thalassomonas viridans]WDE02991.1 methylglyoxal synthase [Thalassomonas viridans]